MGKKTVDRSRDKVKLFKSEVLFSAIYIIGII